MFSKDVKQLSEECYIHGNKPNSIKKTYRRDLEKWENTYSREELNKQDLYVVREVPLRTTK